MASNPTGLSPSSITTSVSVWLDASDSTNFTFSGSNVTQWLDRSGNNKTFVQRLGGFPTLSNMGSIQSLYFPTNVAMVNSNIGISTSYSVFAVANRLTGSAYQYIAKFDAVNDGYFFFGTNTGNFATFGGNGATTWWDVNANSPAVAVGTSPILLEAINDGSLITPYASGSNQTTKTGTTVARTSMLLGCSTANNQFWLGNIGEYIVYNKPLSTPERQQVEGYLAWKWSLTASLPSTHPYKNNPFLSVTETVPRSIPSSAFLVPINTYSTIKTFTLPTVSTNPGRLLILKDYLGYANANNIRLSTTGLDRIERSNVSSMTLSNAYGAWWFQNDGLTNWFLTTAYLNSIPIIQQLTYVTTNLVYFLDAGNPTSYPGSGSTWTNLMGTGYNMTLYGSPTYSSANGGYLTFAPASSQYAESLTSLPLATRFSVEVWHYYTGTNTGTNPCIVTEIFPGTTSQMNYILGCAPAASPAFQISFYTGAWQNSGSYTMTANNWYHIVGTYDGANLQLYINGSLINTTANTATPVSSTGGFRLMRRWDNPDYWGGRLAIYRFYTRALTLAEVSQNFTASRSRFGL